MLNFEQCPQMQVMRVQACPPNWTVIGRVQELAGQVQVLSRNSEDSGLLLQLFRFGVSRHLDTPNTSSCLQPLSGTSTMTPEVSPECLSPGLGNCSQISQAQTHECATGLVHDYLYNAHALRAVDQ